MEKGRTAVALVIISVVLLWGRDDAASTIKTKNVTDGFVSTTVGPASTSTSSSLATSPTPTSQTPTTSPSTTTPTSTSAIEVLPPITHNSSVRNYNWVIALIVLASFGILVVVGLEFYILIKLYGTPLLKDCSSMWLGHTLLFGIFLSYLLMYAFIPYPCPTTCGIIRFCTGVCYALCFSAIVVKLVVIICPEDTHACVAAVLCLFIWAVQIVIDIQWMIQDTPNVVRINNSDGYICNPGFSEHVKSLIYVMVLIVGSLCASVVARCTGNDVNGDAIYIGVSCAITVAVWIVWILLGFLQNNSEWQDPCLAFGLLVTATVLLLLVFVPKIHQLNRLKDFRWDVAGKFKPEITVQPERFTIKSDTDSIVSGTKRRPGSLDEFSWNDSGVQSLEKFNGRQSRFGQTMETVYEDENSLPPNLDPLALHLKYPTTVTASEPNLSRVGSIRSSADSNNPQRTKVVVAVVKPRRGRNLNQATANTPSLSKGQSFNKTKTNLAVPSEYKASITLNQNPKAMNKVVNENHRVNYHYSVQSTNYNSRSKPVRY